MATHDYVIANASGSAVRQDINNALEAIRSNNSNATSPGTTYAYQWWVDTTANQLKIRNSANDAWITLRELDGTILMQDGSAAEPSLCFRTDTDTGFYKDGDGRIGITCGGVERATFLEAGVIFNDAGNDCNFRVESNDNANMLFVDGGNNRVGIGDNAPGQVFVVRDAGATDTSAYVNVISGNAANAGIAFGDTDSDLVGGVLYNHSDNALRFFQSGFTEAARFNDSGVLLVNTTSVLDSSSTSKIQAVSNSGAGLVLGRSDTSVEDGDTLGQIRFKGNDGGTYQNCALIECVAEDNHALNDHPSRLVFSTTQDGAGSPDEKMRIFATGQTHHFSTSNGLFVGSSLGAGTTNWLFRGNRSRTNNTSGGSTVFYVYTNGNVENTNNSYGQISDVKLKENIVNANSQWDDIKGIQVRNFNFKEETGHSTHTQIGVVAQELETVSPGLVYDTPDRDEEGNDLGTVTKGVNYSVLYMKAVKALQEAMERIETLEAKVAALEAG